MTTMDRMRTAAVVRLASEMTIASGMIGSMWSNLDTGKLRPDRYLVNVKMGGYAGRMTETRPYHHGALREALLAAGLDAIAASGPTGWSLRDVARRAGVSHAAPAHH